MFISISLLSIKNALSCCSFDHVDRQGRSRVSRLSSRTAQWLASTWVVLASWIAPMYRHQMTSTLVPSPRVTVKMHACPSSITGALVSWIAPLFPAPMTSLLGEMQEVVMAQTHLYPVLTRGALVSWTAPLFPVPTTSLLGEMQEIQEQLTVDPLFSSVLVAARNWVQQANSVRGVVQERPCKFCAVGNPKILKGYTLM